MARIGLLDEHLTNENSGPAGKTCGQCVEYSHKRCDKFRLMMGRGGPQFGENAQACKFFDAKPQVV